MSERVYEAVEVEDASEDTDTALKDKPWQFQPGQSGNPEGTHITKGIVDYIKARTSNYEQLMDMLLEVTFGRKLPDTDGKPWTYTMQQRLDCLNSLLDRAIGKPKQTIEETGDDTSKEVLTSIQKLIELESGRKVDETTDTVEVAEVSSIEQMSRKGGG